jgi:hypothetical protein
VPEHELADAKFGYLRGAPNNPMYLQDIAIVRPVRGAPVGA